MTVTLPIVVLVGLSALAGGLIFGQSGVIGGALLGGCVFAWPIWAWTVRRWRRSVAERDGLTPNVRRLAVATGLIGPSGSVMEQAETTVRLPLMWAGLILDLAVLVAYVVLTVRGSATLAIACIVAGCLFIAGAIGSDLRRSGSIVATIAIVASIAAAIAWVLLPRILVAAWVSVGAVTFTTVLAVSSLALLVWLPGDHVARQRSTFIGLAVVSIFSLAISTASAARFVSLPASRSEPSRIPVASPTVLATWASFTTGAAKPHQTSADGLQITDVETGTGRAAHPGDVLTVRYIMWLSDGRQADSSDAAGGPFKFTLGTGEVIPGWDEGVPGMAVGGTRRLVIPPSLAYGDRGTANQSGTYVVPPNTTLIFVIQLISISSGA